MYINEELINKYHQDKDITTCIYGGDNIIDKDLCFGNGVICLTKIKFGKESPKINPFDHSHSEYEFIVTINSIGIIRLCKACYIGQAGCCYPVSSMTTHGAEILTEDAEFYSIIINKEYFESYFTSLGLIKPNFQQTFLVDTDFYKTLERYIASYKEEPINEELVDNIAKSIMTYIITKGVENNADQRRARRIYNSKIKAVLDYMCENYKNPDLDVHMLSEYSGFSHTYFTKTFKKYMGENPIVHLNKLRISEAKRLILQDPYRKLNDMHKEIGFKTITNFTEQFKLVTGMKPKQYQYDYARPSEDKLKTRYQIKKEREALKK